MFEIYEKPLSEPFNYYECLQLLKKCVELNIMEFVEHSTLDDEEKQQQVSYVAVHIMENGKRVKRTIDMITYARLLSDSQERQNLFKGVYKKVANITDNDVLQFMNPYQDTSHLTNVKIINDGSYTYNEDLYSTEGTINTQMFKSSQKQTHPVSHTSSRTVYH